MNKYVFSLSLSLSLIALTFNAEAMESKFTFQPGQGYCFDGTMCREKLKPFEPYAGKIVVFKIKKSFVVQYSVLDGVCDLLGDDKAGFLSTSGRLHRLISKQDTSRYVEARYDWMKGIETIREATPDELALIRAAVEQNRVEFDYPPDEANKSLGLQSN